MHFYKGSAKDQVNWDLYRPHIIMAYRASVHFVTRKTPNLLNARSKCNIANIVVTGKPKPNASSDILGRDVYV